MSAGSTVGPAACEGVLIGSQPWKRIHCPGCADAAALRDEVEHLRERVCTVESQRDDVHGDADEYSLALAAARESGGTWMRMAASNAHECERLRDRVTRAEALLASARAVIVHSSFAVGASAARAWLAAHPAAAAIPEGTPTDRK